MLTKNPLFYLVLILALTVGMLAVNFVKAVNRAAEQPFSEPSESFPGGTPELPIDVSSSAQVKKGQLTVNKLVIKAESPYLSKDGIYMKQNSGAATSSPKIYWDDITGGWSNTSGGIYYNGNVSIGTDSLNPNPAVILNVEGQLDMNGNKIISVGSPTEYSDAATKGYADSKVGIEAISGGIYKDENGCDNSYTLVSYFSESSPEARFANSVHGKLWDISIETGKEWDFCFLTYVDYDSCGSGNFKKLKTMACEVIEGYGFVANQAKTPIGDGGWYLRVATDSRSHTRCTARCVRFK